MSEKAKDMTVSEAWTLINKLGKWNVGQKSLSLACGGPRTIEDDIYDLQRAALKTAWDVVARKIDESPGGKAAIEGPAD